MEGEQILEDNVVLPEDKSVLNMGKHKRSLFGMFSGETEKVSIEIHESLIDVVFDLFGEKIKIRKLDNEFVRFTADVQVTPVFFEWCCSFGNKLRSVAPQNIREELKDYIASLTGNYIEEK